MNLNVQRVNVIGLQADLDAAEAQFNTALALLRRHCAHRDTCVYEGVDYGSYTFSAVCLTCGHFENGRDGVLANRNPIRKAGSSDEWCRIRDDVFRPGGR